MPRLNGFCRSSVSVPCHPHATQGQVDMGEVCPTGRVRDMCFVAFPPDRSADVDSGDGVAAKARGVLVTVTSAGGVSVWSVPASLGGSEEEHESEGEAPEELELPLVAAQVVKVREGYGVGLT